MRSLRLRFLLVTGGLAVTSLLVMVVVSSRLGLREFRRIEQIRVTRTDPGSGQPRPAEELSTREEKLFSGSFDRTLLAGAGVVALLAVVAALGLSRRIFEPVEALTRAARRMAEGERGIRVDGERRDEVGELGNAFNAMAEAVAAGEDLRRRLVTDVAHELRTPLTNIRAQLEAMQDGLADAGRPAIDSLHEETLLLSRLIDDLQDLAVAEAGRMAILREPVDLREVADATVEAFASRAIGAGVSMGVRVPDGISPVAADRGRVAQIFRNLVSNALAHTPEGGEIVIGARAADGHAEAWVQDSGSGIPPEDLPNVFDRFYRADRSRSRETGGAGLGLPIVRQIVLAHGGTIRAESRPGAGTVVTFSLPFIENS